MSLCYRNVPGGMVFGKTIPVLNVPVPMKYLSSQTNFSVTLNFNVINSGPVDGRFSEVDFSWGLSKIRVPIAAGWKGAIPQYAFSDDMFFCPPQEINVPHFHSEPIPSLTFNGIKAGDLAAEVGQALGAVKRSDGVDVWCSFLIRFVIDTNMTAYMTEIPNAGGLKTGPISLSTETFPPRPESN